MRFVYPWLLLLLSAIPVIGVIWLWLFRRSLQRLALLIAPALQDKLMPARPKATFYVQFVLVLTGLTFLAFAAARPQWGRKDEKVFTRGRNLVIALDVSRSMLAADVHPNRLERAKTDIMDLIEDLKGDRAALLAFRSKGSLLCPLTTDYAFLRQALDGVSPESAPRGETDLGDAVRKSLEALDPALDEYNAILLISDGEDLKGDALAAAAEAAKRNIPIFTVGIGDTAGTTIPADSGKGYQQFKGTAVQTKLTEQTLSAIAKASNGTYIPLGTAGTANTTLGSIYRNHLRQIAAKEQQEQIENRYQERYQLFLFPAALCLLAAAWFSRGRLCGNRTRAVPAAMAAAMALSSLVPVQAQTNSVPDAQRSTLDAPASPSTNRAAVVVAPGRAGAREAQSWLGKGRFNDAAEGFLSAARGADMEEAESYRYNAAYAYYKAKDFDKGAETLRPLLTSRKNGAKAGELLGKLLMEKAKDKGPEDPAMKAEALEEAATAFQRALRDAPKDERRNRNLTRAVSPLPEARETSHIAKVLKEHGQTAPDQLLGTLLAEQRAILEEAPAIFTNDATRMISQAEALAKRQEKQADLWIPLKQHMLQAVTNQQQQALFAQQIELARDSMKGAVTALQDLLPEAASDTAQPEPLIYAFWKAVVLPPAALDEDIICQSNALRKIKARYLEDRDTQPEALLLTKLFRERFPDWAKQYQQQAQADTNMPPFTAEDQAKIEKIAAHAEKLQNEIVEKKPQAQERLALQEQALKDLLEIRDLLPKQKGQGQQQQQPQQQEQKQDQQQQQQQEQKPEEQQQKQEEQKPEEQKKEPPKDVQEVLRRALDREKEHENDKKEKMRKLPMSPSERDW